MGATALEIAVKERLTKRFEQRAPVSRQYLKSGQRVHGLLGASVQARPRCLRLAGLELADDRP